MQFIVKFVAAIVPYLLRFLDKHSDEYLEMLNKRIVALIGGDKVATIKFHIINSHGEPVANASAGFIIDVFGKVYKHAEGNVISITGFKGGEYEFDISAKDYDKEVIKVVIENENVILEKTIVLR